MVSVDVKPHYYWHQGYGEAADHWPFADLNDPDHCRRVCKGADEVYMLAADMGGIGFIEGHKAECMLSVIPSTNMLIAARDAGVQRYFYSSSACVYPGYLQKNPQVVALRESDAYPADAEDGYGWEKLFTERMCRHFREDYGLETRVARYHNVYGPYGTYDGGREKAPAAICRKVAQAILSDRYEIEIWGDGSQARSYMYVDDCVEGTLRIMESDYHDPLNLGSSELVSVDQLVDVVEEIAGFLELERKYVLDAPKGVAGRNSDNTLIQETLGWQPSISLREGLEKTFAWIWNEMSQD